MVKPTNEVPPNSYSHTARKVFIVGPDGQPAGGEKTYAQIVEIDGDNTYVCLAEPGTLASAASWRVYKQNITGDVTTITWADGNSKFDNVAANRKALSYS